MAAKEQQSSLLHCSQKDVATRLGLPVGLIRTSESHASITQEYSKSLFGGEDDNPARKQRLHRERVAQRAVEKARVALNAAALNRAAAEPSAHVSSSLLDLSNRFSSTKR